DDDALLFVARSLPMPVFWLGSHTKNVNAVGPGSGSATISPSTSFSLDEAKAVIALSGLWLKFEKLKLKNLIRNRCSWDDLFTAGTPDVVFTGDVAFLKVGHAWCEHVIVSYLFVKTYVSSEVTQGHSLHFGRPEFALIIGMRFGTIRFCSYTLKFRNRVFPHKVGLVVTNLDVLGVIKDEVMFRDLCDEDSDSKTNIDIRPTRVEYQSSWWIESNVFFEHHVPKPPEIEHHPLFQAYLSKLEKSRKRLASSFRESSSVCTRDSRLKTRRLTDRGRSMVKVTIKRKHQYYKKINRFRKVRGKRVSVEAGKGRLGGLVALNDLEVDDDPQLKSQV
ncbi:hypothetical protein Tco_0579570, partial [Tanacetum coccineum]